MFTSTRALLKIVRGNISSKRGNKNYYKGRGAPAMGVKAKKGHFIIDIETYAKKTFAVPDLTDFTLKPYVARTTPKVNLNVDPSFYL